MQNNIDAVFIDSQNKQPGGTLDAKHVDKRPFKVDISSSPDGNLWGEIAAFSGYKEANAFLHWKMKHPETNQTGIRVVHVQRYILSEVTQ